MHGAQYTVVPRQASQARQGRQGGKKVGRKQSKEHIPQILGHVQMECVHYSSTVQHLSCGIDVRERGKKKVDKACCIALCT